MEIEITKWADSEVYKTLISYGLRSVKFTADNGKQITVRYDGTGGLLVDGMNPVGYETNLGNLHSAVPTIEEWLKDNESF